MDDLDAVVQGKLDQDADFQASLATLPDEDKESAVNAKKSELVKVVFKEIADAKVKAEEIAKDQKIRAEKAEQLAKNSKPAEEPKKEDLSVKELYTLVEAKVPKEDVPWVTDWARFNKIPLEEALQHDEVKAVLALKAEKRQSAEVSNTNAGRRVSTKDSGEELAKKMERGQFPAEDDIEKAITAKFDLKKKK